MGAASACTQKGFPRRSARLPAPEKPSQFPNTRWTLVLGLRSGSDRHRERAFEELCQAYWRPLYTYARGNGHGIHDAEDLTQGFLAQLLRRGDLGPLSPERGRLRTFLKTAFHNFMADEARRGARQKRGGPTATWLDIESAERQSQRMVSGAVPPDEAFDRHWGRIVLQRALHALRERFRARGREGTLRELEVFLGHDDAAPAYGEVAARLGQSENTVAAAVGRMRREFQDLLRQEIADTLEPGQDIDEELQYLLRVAA